MPVNKNNSSAQLQEDGKDEFLYIKPPTNNPSFRPQLLTDEEIKEEEGGLSAKAWESFKENPLVPAGLTMAFGSLFYGLYCMGTGQREKSYTMMKYRVGFSFLTFVAICGGFYRRELKQKYMALLEEEESLQNKAPEK